MLLIFRMGLKPVKSVKSVMRWKSYLRAGCDYCFFRNKSCPRSVCCDCVAMSGSQVTAVHLARGHYSLLLAVPEITQIHLPPRDWHCCACGHTCTKIHTHRHIQTHTHTHARMHVRTWQTQKQSHNEKKIKQKSIWYLQSFSWHDGCSCLLSFVWYLFF